MKQQQTSSSSLDNGGISLPYSSSTPNLSKHAIVDGIGVITEESPVGEHQSNGVIEGKFKNLQIEATSLVDDP